MKKKNKFYTVWVGKVPGVYTSWDECRQHVLGYPDAKYKGFSTLEQAQKALGSSSDEYIPVNNLQMPLPELELPAPYGPLPDSICVDGACNTETNEIEFQGIFYSTGECVFRKGPYLAGTNNIAEFLAIVCALGYCKSNSLTTAIYSDSHTAITWVQKKKASTTLEPVSDGAIKLLSFVHKAEEWLKNNQYGNKILKWETTAWGENPADFGRK